MSEQHSPTIAAALLALFEKVCAAEQQLPWMEYNPDWTSICQQVDTLKNDQIQWQPEINPNPSDFSNIEYALDCQLHHSIAGYFGSFWSVDIEALHPKGPVTLLQVFNPEDLATLQQNIIGHIMMKQRLKQPITVFIAVTDEDDQMISVVNDSGEVWLEYVGQQPHLKLADSVIEFIDLLNA